MSSTDDTDELGDDSRSSGNGEHGDGSSETRLFAERLNRIWAQAEVDRGGKLVLRKVVDELAAGRSVRGEPIESFKISLTYLNNLKRGEVPNPTLRILRAMRMYFAVPLDFFVTPDETEAAALLVARNVIVDGDLSVILQEASKLPPSGRAMIRATVIFVRDHWLRTQHPDQQETMELPIVPKSDTPD